VTRKVAVNGKEWVLIACKDQGAGLSATNLKLLFREGMQFNANKLQAGGGSGFGLFITKGIVMLHKGANIWAESDGEGKGCTFYVELPLEVVAASSSEDEGDEESESDDESDDDSSVDSFDSDPQQDQKSRASGGEIVVRHRPGSVVLAVFKPRVLIVDDSAMSRRMLARMLEAEGFECDQAVDGLAAVAYVSRADLHRRPDSDSAARPSRDEVRSSPALAHLMPDFGSGGSIPPMDEQRPQRRAMRSPTASRLPSSTGLGRSPAQTPRSTQTPRVEPPDVILMDSNMPKMNGPDAVLEIRKLGYTFPIFGVTGDEDHAVFMRAGADGVMMKPVRAAELISTIHIALRKVMSGAGKQPSTSPRQFHIRLADRSSASSEGGVGEGRYVTQEYASKMETWLTTHAPKHTPNHSHKHSPHHSHQK
jgi:DNA-binding response OmpR family regulator